MNNSFFCGNSGFLLKNKNKIFIYFDKNQTNNHINIKYSKNSQKYYLDYNTKAETLLSIPAIGNF